MATNRFVQDARHLPTESVFEHQGVQTHFVVHRDSNMWQDNEIRFDCSFNNIQPRLGEHIVDRLNLIEDTKGNAGDTGRLIITNLRIIWHSASLARINLSMVVVLLHNIRWIKKLLGTHIQALYILASYKNCRYEFLFTNLDTKCTRHYTSVIGVHRAYVSSKIYREIKLRSGIINDGRLTLLPQEKIQSTYQDVWNLSVEQGNIGTLIVTNIRLVWYADINHHFNVSIPYLTVGSISIRTSKFGPTLVITSTEASGGYILGFRINPLQKLDTLHKEVSVLLKTFEKSPIFGVEYTFEHETSTQQLDMDQYSEVEESNSEISNVFGYYFSEGGTNQRKPNYSDYLGLAVEEPKEGSTLQSTWELVSYAQ